MFKPTLVFLATIISLAFGTDIPSGFQLVGNKYVASQETATFFQALIECHTYGYKLATVSSSEEEQQLENASLGSINYWLGAVYQPPTDIFAGKWVWIDTKDEVTYENWASTEPSLSSGTNCIGLYYNRWYAYPCTNTFRFVCEI